MRLFQGGKIASEDQPELIEADVLVDDDGRISRVGKKITPPQKAEQIDCAGKILVPGMFDIHVHAREPGYEHKEDLASCTRAALNGGITGMALMPDTSPVIDNGNLLRRIVESARDISPVEILQMGAISKDLAGEELAAIGGLALAGAPMLSDSGNCVPSPIILKRAMEYAIEFDLPLASRGDVASLSKNGSMNEGSASYRLGLPGIPSIAQEIGIDRDIRIAQYTGGNLHVQQVSTAIGMKSIQRAREDGVQISCEVSPHHLLLHEEEIPEYDCNFKMNPPLRRKEDTELLLEGLVNGVIDVVATDHSPHTRYEKTTDFASAPFGITGLETAVISMFDRLIKPNILSWQVLVKRFSAEPRRLMKRDPVAITENASANFFVFDPEGETTFSSEYMKSKSPNTPWIDQTLCGKICEVVIGTKGDQEG